MICTTLPGGVIHCGFVEVIGITSRSPALSSAALHHIVVHAEIEGVSREFLKELEYLPLTENI